MNEPQTNVDKKPISKWAEWAKRRAAAGLCVVCGDKANVNGRYCEHHRQLDLQRKRLAYRAKHSGSLRSLIESGKIESVYTDPIPFIQSSSITQAAPIMSEICERLLELEQIKLGLGIGIVNRLAGVSEVSHMAFRYTIRLMHGDAAIFDSFETQAAARAMTKQAAHAEFHAVLSIIERAFPELAYQIGDIRRQVSRTEEQAPAGVNRQGMRITANRSINE